MKCIMWKHSFRKKHRRRRWHGSSRRTRQSRNCWKMTVGRPSCCNVLVITSSSLHFQTLRHWIHPFLASMVNSLSRISLILHLKCMIFFTLIEQFVKDLSIIINSRLNKCDRPCDQLGYLMP